MSQETIKVYQGGADCGQALVTLEGFIGDMDGKTIGTETAEGLFDDEGTVDTSDAVTAINALIWSIEQRDAEIEKLRAALKQAVKFTNECSDPQGWLATNVRHVAEAAVQQTGEHK